MENVLYHASNLEDWVDVADIMQDRHDWIPKYWIGAPKIEEYVKSSFPDVVFQYKKAGARCVPPDKYRDSYQFPLSKEEITEQAHEQLISIKMMDRMDPDSIFDYDQRVRNHIRLLMYWKNVLLEEEIDRVIFELPPHVIIDYVLYIACKQMDIETVMLKEAISLPAFVYSQSELGELPKGFDGPSDSGQPIPSSILDYVQEIEESSSSNNSNNPSGGKISSAKRLFQKVYDVIPHPLKIQDSLPRARIKEPNVDIEDSEYNYLKYKMMRNKAKLKRRRLKSKYNELSHKVDLEPNYVYFPLHYQPELTTSPQGDIFVHQFIAANLLSCCLPDGWKLYIKEHPLQFSKGERGREAYHYRHLLKLNSVELVDLHMDQIELIDNADIVSTITGTSGWEAIVRSTPVIAFGNAWYRGCEGVFYADSKKDVRDAISAARNGYQISRQQIDEFLNELSSVGFEGYVLRGGGKSTDWVGKEENVRGIVNQLEMHL